MNDLSSQVFDDQDYAYYLLCTLKDLEKKYCIMMIDASNEWLYGIYRDLLLDVACLQRKVYHMLFLNGWYLLEPIQESLLKEKYHLFFSQYKKLLHKR